MAPGHLRAEQCLGAVDLAAEVGHGRPGQLGAPGDHHVLARRRHPLVGVLFGPPGPEQVAHQPDPAGAPGGLGDHASLL